MINKIYLNKDISGKIMGGYLDKGMIRLDNFFDAIFNKEMFDKVRANNGEHIKIVDRYSYEKLDIIEFKKIFNNKEFLNFVNLISCENFDNCEINITRFAHGDYTLLYDFIVRKGMEFLFLLADKWDDKFGGYVVYTDNEKKNFIFSIKGNSFILIDKKGMGRFVKYVNHLSGKRNFVIIEGKFW